MNRTNLKVRHILDDIPTKEEFQEVIEKVKLTPRSWKYWNCGLYGTCLIMK